MKVAHVERRLRRASVKALADRTGAAHKAAALHADCTGQRVEIAVTVLNLVEMRIAKRIDRAGCETGFVLAAIARGGFWRGWQIQFAFDTQGAAKRDHHSRRAMNEHSNRA